MDGLLPLIFVLIAISSAISKSKKQAAAKRRSVVSPVAKPDVPARDRRPIRHEMKPHVPQARTVMQPRVESQIETAGMAAEIYAGSLHADTHEGEDPCHEAELTPVAAPAAMIPTPVERPGLTLDWHGDSMVKAFIMQEVLTRPCQRHAAGR